MHGISRVGNDEGLDTDIDKGLGFVIFEFIAHICYGIA